MRRGLTEKRPPQQYDRRDRLSIEPLATGGEPRACPSLWQRAKRGALA